MVFVQMVALHRDRYVMPLNVSDVQQQRKGGKSSSTIRCADIGCLLHALQMLVAKVSGMGGKLLDIYYATS